jgi:hypothetical protein
MGTAIIFWAFPGCSPSSPSNPLKASSNQAVVTHSLQFPRQSISSTKHGVVDLEKEQWQFMNLFFPEEMVLEESTADGLVVYQQGYEYVSFMRDPPLYGRTSFKRGLAETVIDQTGHLLVLQTVDKDVVIREMFSKRLRKTFPRVLQNRDIVSLGYHPQSRYCGILYRDFSLEVFNDAGKSVFSYVSQTQPLHDDDTSGQHQNIYFRDATTLYFFDRVVLMKVDLTKKTATAVYTVRGLEKHSGYHYTFNAFSNTVSMFSEYCAGCDLGGEVRVLDVDTLNPVNRLSTREYGLTLSFCKYYRDKFVTAGYLFETFTIHEMGKKEGVAEQPEK